MSTKAERERKGFARTARGTFGVKAGVTDAQPAIPGFDPRLARREEERLSAVADRAKASSCRLCGVAVQPTDDHTVVSGWKTCASCVPLLDGLHLVWSDVLDPLPTPVSPHEATQLGNPCRFVFAWPSDPGEGGRWANVDVEAKRAELTRLRAEASAASAVRRSAEGLGCAWCGRSHSTRWVRSPWRTGTARRDPYWPLCDECSPAAQRAGAFSGEGWRSYLFALAVGLKRPQMDLHFDLRAFFESGAEPSGTDQPWSYLGDLRQTLRWKIIRRNARWLIALTEREARVLALEAVDTTPPPKTALARLD
jgi:hypothetical protein